MQQLFILPPCDVCLFHPHRTNGIDRQVETFSLRSPTPSLFLTIFPQDVRRDDEKHLNRIVFCGHHCCSVRARSSHDRYRRKERR